MKQIVFIAILSIITLGFSGRPPRLPKPKNGEWIEPPRQNSIYNNWTWIETDCCGIRHGLTTPSTTGDNIELDLNPDNSFTEVHTKINAFPRSGSFTMYKEGDADMIQFNDERPARYYLSDNGDTLTLSWKYLELQTERYIKKQQ
jgi:hypothetical protein